jgi:hypothetical protein
MTTFTPEQHQEIAKYLKDFEEILKSFSVADVKQLISNRVYYGEKYEEFFRFIEAESKIEEHKVLFTKFKRIYWILGKCGELGYPQIFDAFEMDLAKAAIQIGVNRFIDKVEEYDYEDFERLVKMPPEEVYKLMDKHKDELGLAPLVVTIVDDKDENGDTIYF